MLDLCPNMLITISYNNIFKHYLIQFTYKKGFTHLNVGTYQIKFRINKYNLDVEFFCAKLYI